MMNKFVNLPKENIKIEIGSTKEDGSDIAPTGESFWVYNEDETALVKKNVVSFNEVTHEINIVFELSAYIPKNLFTSSFNPTFIDIKGIKPKPKYTSVGFYDDMGVLMAVGKIREPLRTDSDIFLVFKTTYNMMNYKYRTYTTTTWYN